MFLDPAGPVTVQRFEEVAYPKLQKFERIARGFFWDPEEVSLTKDKADMKTADEATAWAFTKTILRQTALDSLQGRAPALVFGPVASVPEVELIASNWSFFETNIHSASYSHIIRNVYNVPKDQFNSLHDIQPIIDMAAGVGRYYDDLHNINSRVALIEAGEKGIRPVTEKEHIKAIWLALNASYALECIRFLSSFLISLGMKENRIFMGNGNIIELILQDELLHTDWTAYLINQVVKDDPRFAQAKIDCADEVYAMYLEVIREEKDWAPYLFQKGPVVGVNTKIAHDFIDHRATVCLKDIGIKYLENPIKNNPATWFNKYLESSKQPALQETENTSYVLNAMTTNVRHDELPDI